MILVRKNVYKVFDLLKMFSSFERCFESVGVCFENRQDVLVLKMIKQLGTIYLLEKRIVCSRFL